MSMEDLDNLHVVVHQNGAEFKSKGDVEREAKLNCHVHEHCPCMCCWNEADDGVIPFCKSSRREHELQRVTWWKIFNPLHLYTNNNAWCFLFGTIGFRIFDRKRKTIFAVALWTTFVSIFLTVWGCMAFSSNPTIVRDTYWITLSLMNETSGKESGVYMGLSSMVLVSEPCELSGCKSQNFIYGNDLIFGGYTLIDSEEKGIKQWPVGDIFLKNHMSLCRETL